MGMDYQYAGSASYPRFEKEIADVAALLGCAKTRAADVLKTASDAEPLGRWFGFMSGLGPDDEVFAVPESLPEPVAEWLNRPYESRTPEETAAIWSAVSSVPAIEDAAYQIWRELEQLAAYGEGWDLN